MAALYVLFEYVFWIYSRGIREYFRAWMNYHWFLFHFFSVGVLLKSLFAPFHRLQEKAGRGIDIERFFERLVVNIMMRVVGFVVRVAVLAVALISEVFLFVAGVALFVLFLSSPVVLPVAFIAGFDLLFISIL